MNAYQKGRSEAGTRKDRIRRYQTDKAEREYWRGYIDEMRDRMPEGEMLVRCERDGAIFAAAISSDFINCPACSRHYTKKGSDYMSDRKLTIL